VNGLLRPLWCCTFLLAAGCVGEAQLPSTLSGDPGTVRGPDGNVRASSLKVQKFLCARSGVHPLEARCDWEIQSPAPESLRCSINAQALESPCPAIGSAVHRFEATGTQTLVFTVEDSSGSLDSTLPVEVGGGWSIATFEVAPARPFRGGTTTFRWTLSGIAIPVPCTLDVNADGVAEKQLPDCSEGIKTHRLDAEGTFDAVLTVNDGVGTTLQKTTRFVVGPPPPDVTLLRADWGQTVIKPNLRLVAGKQALLRAVVLADANNVAPPQVRVRALMGATELGAMNLTGPASLPTADTTDTAQTFRAVLPSEWIQAGVQIRVEADPNNAMDEKDEENNVLTISPTVGSGTVLNLTVVPVVHQGTTASVPNYQPTVFAIWPVQRIQATQRTPYTFSGQLGANDGNAWQQLLTELSQLRTADGSARYYYGFVRVNYGSGIAGIGYIGRPVAVGRDDAPGVETMAHELGHNFGREHAPCGGPAGADPAFPYAGGRVGGLGFDLAASTLKAATLFDLMSYCNPVWISDYTYLAAQSFLERTPPAATFETAQEPGAMMLITGRLSESGTLTLNPVHRLETFPTPSEDGPYRLEVAGSNGVTQVSFLPARPSEGAEEHFAVSVPDVGSIQELRVWKDNTLMLRRLPSPAAQALTSPAVQTREEPGSLVLTWNAQAYPRAMVAHVADARTTLALALQGGQARVSTEGLPTGGRFEISLSNGLDSLRVDVPR
jgi:hypothetical protein